MTGPCCVARPPWAFRPLPRSLAWPAPQRQPTLPGSSSTRSVPHLPSLRTSDPLSGRHLAILRPSPPSIPHPPMPLSLAAGDPLHISPAVPSPARPPPLSLCPSRVPYRYDCSFRCPLVHFLCPPSSHLPCPSTRSCRPSSLLLSTSHSNPLLFPSPCAPCMSRSLPPASPPSSILRPPRRNFPQSLDHLCSLLCSLGHLHLFSHPQPESVPADCCTKTI